MELNKDKLVLCLKELGKRLRKQFRDFKVDVWIVGGANIVYSFDFRESTVDIDIIKNRSIDIRDIVLSMEEEFDLPHNWINDSVMFSESFSMNLRKYSGEVREFGHCLVCHFLKPVAIACMKVRANRPEKGDIIDSYNICLDRDLTLGELESCYTDLYSSELPAAFSSNLTVLQSYYTSHVVVSKSADFLRLLKVYGGNINNLIEDTKLGVL